MMKKFSALLVTPSYLEPLKKRGYIKFTFAEILALVEASDKLS